MPLLGCRQWITPSGTSWRIRWVVSNGLHHRRHVDAFIGVLLVDYTIGVKPTPSLGCFQRITLSGSSRCLYWVVSDRLHHRGQADAFNRVKSSRLHYRGWADTFIGLLPIDYTIGVKSMPSLGCYQRITSSGLSRHLHWSQSQWILQLIIDKSDLGRAF